MISPLQASITFVALSSSLYTTCAYTILDRQCWHETILQTVTLQSHPASILNNTFELVTPSTTRITTPVSFHLPWPWTYPPLCTPVLPGPNSRLCVYTSSTFARGRGISIVTTPSLAAHFASLPAFTTPSLLDAVNTNKFSSSWTTSSIPSKGTGTLALHPLSPPSQILRYTPAFLAYLEASLSTLSREALWSTAIHRLPAPTRTSFLNLTYIYGDARVRIQDITKANTFQLDIFGINHLAVVPEPSRLNHDCAPNAQYVLDPETLTHSVRVTREIAQGEEVTIAYASPLERVAVRRERLAHAFHFECRCRRCVEGERSDAVVARIEELQARLNDWGAEVRGGPDMAAELLRLYVGEGLEGFLDVPFGFAALAWNAVGRVGEARVWAGKAREALLMKEGKSAEALRIWDALLDDAEGHWSYRRRLYGSQRDG